MKNAGLASVSLHVLEQHMAYMQLKHNFCVLITLSVWQLSCTTALVASLPNSWPVGRGKSSHTMNAKVIFGPSDSLSWQQKLQGTTAFFKL